MKVVIFSAYGAEKIMGHFIAYGYDDFILYGKSDKEYYGINGIKVTEVAAQENETSRDKLLKIKGSLTERFVVVYSCGACELDLDELEREHKESQCTATIAIVENKMCAVVLEEEIFDYMSNTQSFERETLLRVGQDGELTLYKQTGLSIQ